MEAASKWQLSGIGTADRSWPDNGDRCKECRTVECRITGRMSAARADA
jgi:hypothetical protein